MFCVNAVGSEILELLGAGNNEAQIAARLNAAYGREIDSVRADVHDFLEALKGHHILEETRAATGGHEASQAVTDAS
jgi:hypothetical protein